MVKWLIRIVEHMPHTAITYIYNSGDDDEGTKFKARGGEVQADIVIQMTS